MLLTACSAGPKPASTVTPDSAADPSEVSQDTQTTDEPIDSGAPEADDEPSLPEVTIDPVTPSMTAEEAAAALSTALGTLPDGGEILAAYRMLMANGDEVCPGAELYITDDHLRGCEASTGYAYAGVTEWYEGPVDELSNGAIEGVAGDFWITTPDGLLFEGGGHSFLITGDDGWVQDLRGSWLWDGGEPWLAHGFSGTLKIDVLNENRIKMSGGAQVNGTSWFATNLRLKESCDYGPKGSLGIRDPSGGWYDMSFEDCDPCALVVFEETELGVACVNFAPFLAAVEGLQ